MQHSEGPPRLAFFGNVGNNTWGNRSACWRALKHTLPAGALASSFSSWTSREGTARALGALGGIHLNLHRWCGNVSSPVAFEAFRAALLLSAGAVLISERSHPRDEAAFSGMVTFASLQDIPRMYARISRLSREQRQAMGDVARARFERSFTAVQVFERAGIYAQLDSWLLSEAYADLPPPDHGKHQHAAQPQAAPGVSSNRPAIGARRHTSPSSGTCMCRFAGTRRTRCTSWTSKRAASRAPRRGQISRTCCRAACKCAPSQHAQPLRPKSRCATVAAPSAPLASRRCRASTHLARCGFRVAATSGGWRRLRH